ncbi:MAG: prolipoprotein diacylglyceryl transferase [Candidatus Dasytiphilus stammeri]
MNTHYFIFPHVNPIMLSLGPISIHWYGMMYLIGFGFTLWLGLRRALRSKEYNQEEIENLFYIGFVSIIIGGRLGYALFYNLPMFIEHPLNLFKIWQGGMSFHGGLLGVIIFILFFSFRTQRHFFKVSDFVVPLIPFGLGIGRLGNFINGELWGRVAINLPWAMIFPHSYQKDMIFLIQHPEVQPIIDHWKNLPRHPSQLYEFFLEGIILFIILNVFIRQPRPIGSVSALFLIIYGIFRFIVEFFREPDIQLGLFKNVLSMGQILSIPMILIGIIIMIIVYISEIIGKEKKVN